MRNKLGQFVKGHKQPKSTKEAIKIYWSNRPKKRIAVNCTQCGTEFYVFPYRKEKAKFCSYSCRSIKTGENRVKNAKPILRHGYMYIRMPSYHRAHKQGGYAKIADLVLEKKLGRNLEDFEIAHHVDGCKTNDSPENLELMTNKEHSLYHLSKYRNK